MEQLYFQIVSCGFLAMAQQQTIRKNRHVHKNLVYTTWTHGVYYHRARPRKKKGCMAEPNPFIAAEGLGINRHFRFTQTQDQWLDEEAKRCESTASSIIRTALYLLASCDENARDDLYSARKSEED